MHEHVFQAGLPGREVRQFETTVGDHPQQLGQHAVRFIDSQMQLIIIELRLDDAWQRADRVEVQPSGHFRCVQLDDVCRPETANQLVGRSQRDALAMVDHHQPITQRRGLVHVVGRQQNRSPSRRNSRITSRVGGATADPDRSSARQEPDDAFAALCLDPWRLRVFPGTMLLEGRGDVLTWQA